MPLVKLFPLALIATIALCACNTLENRRSLYSTEEVHGPYTRALEEGTWGNPKTVDEQYSQAQREKNWPALAPGEKKPAPGALGNPAVVPDASLPQ